MRVKSEFFLMMDVKHRFNGSPSTSEALALLKRVMSGAKRQRFETYPQVNKMIIRYINHIKNMLLYS